MHDIIIKYFIFDKSKRQDAQNSFSGKYRQKGIDEEKYTRFRMNREKVVGENFREGRMEVTFELWAEQDTLSRFQRRFPPLSREAISEEQRNSIPFPAVNSPGDGIMYFPVLYECRSISEFRWYHGHVVRPKRWLRAIFLSVL